MNGLKVKQPGLLSLIQDAGRFGQHRIGLTTGGPLDAVAMGWANRLVHNPANASAIECSFGGLEVELGVDTLISVTGGDQDLFINDQPAASWRSHRVCAGDLVRLGFATRFCRSYLAVAGGLQVAKQFGSTATVVREGIGGLDGDKLQAGQVLPCAPDTGQACLQLVDAPIYSNDIELRVIPGYQQTLFSRQQQLRFFNSDYEVTDRADRMGYRLQGPAIACERDGILSEGICQGAIQIPADGQPIVLLSDRQTIGGYPKIGSGLSLDCARLAQLMPGARVRFREITAYDAHNALHLAASNFQRHRMETLSA
jgi:biotin-dependent carboxylase-like uncharacterized protein